MLHKFRCEPTSTVVEPLDLVWDDETLELQGRGAAEILEMSKDSGVVTHPHPTYYKFKGGAGDGVHISMPTLALLISRYHHIPEILVPALPKHKPRISDAELDRMSKLGIHITF